MKKSIVNQAYAYYVNGEYDNALKMYKKAADLLGYDNFKLNIAFCQLKLKLVRNDGNLTEALDKVLIFTNLGLSTIDGSSVFIANIVSIFSLISREVHLLSVHECGDNFRERIDNISKVKFIITGQDDIKEKISKLNLDNDYEKIFVRAFGDRNAWFSPEYANKVMYYWPLVIDPTNEDRLVYGSVDTVVFQTKELSSYTFALFGVKKSLLIPPLVNSVDQADKFKNQDARIKISYVGTLRPECYSIDLIESIKKVINYNDDVSFNLAIGKIFYKNFDEKKRLYSLIDDIKLNKNILVEEKVSPSRCDEILAESHISFSLWEPTPENSRQVSTKLLECLEMGVNVICIKTPLYERLLGSNYPFFLDTIDDLPRVLDKIINSMRLEKTRYHNRFFLSRFSMAAHVLNLCQYFGLQGIVKDSSEKTFFQNQFDKIYGVWIDEVEKKKLEYLANLYGIPIHLFQGTNGKEQLKNEFKEYLLRPLSTEWEIKAGKKRLTIGAMGHLHSFIRIARDAIANNYKKILVLEADVIFHKNFFDLNYKNTVEDFKVYYYGAGKWNDNVFISSDSRFYHPNQTTGTFAIAFDQDILEECISEWSKYIEPTDVALWKVTDKYNSDCYVVSPNLIICDVATSTTTSQRSQKELSKKFNWNLNDYNVVGYEYIDKYVSSLRIELDYYIDSAFLEFHLSDNLIRIDVTSSIIILELNDVLIGISHEKIFLKKIDFF